MKEPFVTELCEKEEISKNVMGVISSKHRLLEAMEQPKSICVFGACLDQLTSVAPNLDVPFILSRLCGYIEKYGLLEESLFQVKEKEQVVADLKKQFNEYGDAPLESKGDIPAVAKLLIIFLEELPEPLIPVAVCSISSKEIKNFPVDSIEFLQYLRSLVDRLPIHTFCALKYLCHFLTLVTMHADVNGMNCTDIGLIFGPLIFRAGPENSAVLSSFARNATCTFVSDYYSIFEDEEPVHANRKSKENIFSDARQVAPLPSSIAPLINLKPLNVMIPHMDENLKDERDSNNNKSVPTLLIERHLKVIKDICPENTSSAAPENFGKNSSALSIFSTRKRKDKIYVESPTFAQDKETALSSLYTELIESQKVEIREKKQLSQHISNKEKSSGGKNLAECHKLLILLPRPICFESDSSPHPPNPKRRELEIFDSQHNSSEDNIAGMESVEEEWIDGSEEALPYDDCDTSCSDVMYSTELSPFPRSASCPISIQEDVEDADSRSALSLSWNKLFDSVEPVRAQHRLSWPVLNMVQDDSDVIPAIANQHKSYEAPLSPSAFKPYLSHRSVNIDPSIPPSPPGEQEKFDLTIKEDGNGDSLKIISKNIHSLKKKLKHFDKKYEKEHGYKPTYAEKISCLENKKLLDEMNKLKQKLKVLKEESQSTACTSAQNWCLASKVHVLEDTTNCLENKEPKDFSLKSKPTMETLWDEALKSLEDDRKLLNRPECLEHMTKEQVEDEKLAIQKALLRFESIHGKPKDYADRNKIRPLYERYRNVKHLVKSSSFSSNSINTGVSLQPIIEHEAMDFTVKQNDIQVSEDADINENSNCDQTEKSTTNGSHYQVSLHNKYNNSNLHELSVTALVSEHHHARHEKRRLRKLLREFEADFLRANGRKVQKEDKAPVEDYYVEYKFIKARIKLLEALMSKHGMHSSSS